MNQPPPLSPAERRRYLSMTAIGRKILDDEDQAARENGNTPAVSGLTPEQRRHYLGQFGAGRRILADEAKRKRLHGDLKTTPSRTGRGGY